MLDRPQGATTATTSLGAWRMCVTATGACATPRDILDDAEFLSAQVPGTVAATLRDHGLFDPANPRDLDEVDAWYVTQMHGHGLHRLRFEGLATHAEVFVDGVSRLTSTNMFVAHEIDVELVGVAELAIVFRGLGPRLREKAKRARWRPRNIKPSTLRGVRTSLLSRLPGQFPPIHALGPWRAISLVSTDAQDAPVLRSLVADHDGTHGSLDVAFAVSASATGATLTCAGRTTPLARRSDGTWRGRLTDLDVAPWWPHTHGTPALHDVVVAIDGRSHIVGRAGFRRLAIDRGADGLGFGLHVNGEPVFCRGACWTTPDIVGLPGTRAAYEPLLRGMVEAGMNMVRVGGTMAYETRAFHDLCDELGLLVWQDLMFANFDYPFDDDAFAQSCLREVSDLMARVQGSPSLAIVCGGSEIAQQAAMFGLPRERWSHPMFEDTFAGLVADARPDVAYVPNTPMGGTMPFEPGTGITHYYGVSFYRREIEDARTSNVRFAPEGLGHANLPARDDTLTFDLERRCLQHAGFGGTFDNDPGATSSFEAVRHHYMHTLYGVDAQRLFDEDRAHYLDLSRAVNAELMEAVYALWRRTDSPTAGGLVWFLRDVAPCAGFGVLDHAGAPKPVWYALKRAFRPLNVTLVDDGLNGLTVHLVNEGAAPRDVTLDLACLRAGATVVMQGERRLTLAPRARVAIPACDLWGGFFDTTYAYRFGPPSHDVTCARLRAADNDAPFADAFHFPLGRGGETHDLGLAARLERIDDDSFDVVVSTRRFAQSVHGLFDGWRMSDDWFHLSPLHAKRIRLVRCAGRAGAPSGTLRAINGRMPCRMGDA